MRRDGHGRMKGWGENSRENDGGRERERKMFLVF